MFFRVSTILCALLLAPTTSSAQGVGKSHSLRATMTARQVVSPDGKRWSPPSGVAHASGTFTATLAGDGRTLSWRLSYSHVGRARVVAADVHIGGPGKFGPILFRVCGPCKSGRKGTTKLKSGYGLELRRSPHWLTVVTDTYPNGVLRGQIVAR